ncbi:MAG: hypothetical protein ABWY06_05060 [Pseudomonas sp.]|uniref:hypothetical protein n=1 Tax=Pseudomonas sp. TaxID=306 RepID=UPI003394B868
MKRTLLAVLMLCSLPFAAAHADSPRPDDLDPWSSSEPHPSEPMLAQNARGLAADAPAPPLLPGLGTPGGIPQQPAQDKQQDDARSPSPPLQPRPSPSPDANPEQGRAQDAGRPREDPLPGDVPPALAE